MTTEAGIIYLPNRWSGDTHSDKDTGCVDVEATEQLIAKQAAEIERLTACLKRANDNHEHFEREWYLRGEVLDKSEALLLQALVLLRGPAPNGYGVGSEQEAVIAAIKTHLGKYEQSQMA